MLRINAGAAVVYEPIVSAAVVRRTNRNWLHSALSDVRSEGECLDIASPSQSHASFNFSSLILAINFMNFVFLKILVWNN